jgi:hypothetical protein
VYDTVKIAIRKEVNTLDIAALGMAVVYVLILLAGALGALLVLVWLLRDTPQVGSSTGRETFRVSRSADSLGSRSTSSARAERERLEDKAA